MSHATPDAVLGPGARLPAGAAVPGGGGTRIGDLGVEVRRLPVVELEELDAAAVVVVEEGR
ncbi:hypothetical protein [Streptomyces pseudovenezuelae]|uniref:hypothetical protein n=1 Tax=Streptomyces pseudovenezuelae TaxID=67350 RepID=UPI0024741F12|nr:hypothetical protein [Streptomyces pseudovenezuelae]